MRKIIFLLVVLVCSATDFGQQTTEGSLYAVGKAGRELGSCPLKTTSVKTDISGFMSRVRVRQEFQNTFTEAIEAVYIFPLSQNGAVDDMTMTIGERRHSRQDNEAGRSPQGLRDRQGRGQGGAVCSIRSGQISSPNPSLISCPVKRSSSRSATSRR